MRYFGLAATSVTPGYPKIVDDNPEVMKTFTPPPAPTSYGHASVSMTFDLHEPPPFRFDRARPGIKPPDDAKTEGWTWAAWHREASNYQLPGWTFCRFAIGTNDGRAAFVFGLTRCSYGIHHQTHQVAGAMGEVEKPLAIMTHLATGVSVAIFESIGAAVYAAEIADQSAQQFIDRNSPAWMENVLRTTSIWNAAGIRTYADVAVVDNGMVIGGLMYIDQSALAERPARFS